MSLPLGRFFTPSLEAKQKCAVFETLGLGSLELLFAETTKDLLLRVVQYRGMKPEVLVEPAKLAEWQESRHASLLPSLELSHSTPLRQIPFASQSLWEVILPFPYNLLARHSNDPSVSVIGNELLATVETLTERLADFEAQLTQTEVGVLFLQGEGVNFPLLIHSVRGKKIRVGTGPLAQRAAEIYQSDKLSEGQLFSLFGTSATFLPTQYLTQSLEKEAEPIRGGLAIPPSPSWL